MTPRNVRGIPLGIDGDGIAVDNEFAILGLDGTLEAAVGRIVLKHVCLYGGKYDFMSCLLEFNLEGRPHHIFEVDEGAVKAIG